MHTIVYKLGGSLLTLPVLAGRLTRLFEQPFPAAASQRVPPPRRLVVVGGGQIADVVRAWDRLHALGDIAAHELAMEAMSFNARLLTMILADAEPVADRNEAIDAWTRER